MAPKAPKGPSMAVQAREAKGDAAEAKRKTWESSAAGQTRSKDIVDYATDAHNKLAVQRPELGLKPQARLNMSPAQAYAHHGFHQDTSYGPGMHDRQLPGLEDPDAMPQAKRWEEHSPDEQADIQSRVRAKSGATLDSMTHALGSQLDQAHMRAQSHGHDMPYGTDFYTSGEPAQVLAGTAKRRGVSMGLVAAINADTSPQMRFKHTDSKGHTRFPNAEQAEHVIGQIQSGVQPEHVSKEGLTGLARTGFNTNLRKAARRAHQVIKGGRAVSDTFGSGGDSGVSGFGPKTSAYHNSWLRSTPDFTTSDVHTGGGALPHLSPEKPFERDDTGDVKIRSGGSKARSKSEREKVIETAGFHAMNDYAMRSAMNQRGFGRVRQAQASQWGEEQLQRRAASKDMRVAKHFPSEEHAYPQPAAAPEPDSNQGSLFSDRRNTPRERPIGR